MLNRMTSFANYNYIKSIDFSLSYAIILLQNKERKLKLWIIFLMPAWKRTTTAWIHQQHVSNILDAIEKAIDRQLDGQLNVCPFG